MRNAKFGAVFYTLWGLLHILAALDEFRLAATLESGIIQGKLNQGAWDLLIFSLAAIVIAFRLNWRNDRLGYWLNLVLVSAADIGFILFVFLPGHVAFFPGILGPAFWLLGAFFSTLGIRNGASGG